MHGCLAPCATTALRRSWHGVRNVGQYGLDGGSPVAKPFLVIPAFAGMTKVDAGLSAIFKPTIQHAPSEVAPLNKAGDVFPWG